jgi:Na+/H+ antiporter NhaD/arsenite permease-like protein
VHRGSVLRWVLVIVLGAALGAGWSAAMPPGVSGAGPAHAAHTPRVQEVHRDGVILECLPGGATRPWSDAPMSPETAEQAGAAGGHAGIEISPVLCVPFALLLGGIALMPFIHARFWSRYFPDVSFFLGALVTGYYLAGLGSAGLHAVEHAAVEYYSFIALVGGLYVVSGGVLIRSRGVGGPRSNTLLLGFGAILANVVGTTGASMLLIRPFMRMNAGRLRPIHIVMFIFIVSNCGGCLTPIGDPPLYLGYLKGVPFSWTAVNLWPAWLVCVGVLLAIFCGIDSLISPAPAPTRGDHGTVPETQGPLIVGAPAIVCLVLLVAGVFIDPMLDRLAGVRGVPIGATFQLIVAVGAYFLASPEIHRSNAFNFHPVEEVGFLFAGIFLTMMPALGYLEANGGRFGIETPGQFYFITGGLSAVLDNAPTYLNFLQTAMGVLHLPLDAQGVSRFISSSYVLINPGGDVRRFEGAVLLEAISLAAVFFGAMTYIGNGPNFMVKAIAESSGVKMPSFFGYLGIAAAVMIPVAVLVWALFVR